MNLLRRLSWTTITNLLGLLSSANAFSFYFTSTPTQCSQTTVQWNGGQPPYTLLLVPTGHLNPETRTIIQRNILSGNSVSFVLDFPAGSSFVAVLNDATEVGAGGTSKVITVADSSDSTCLNTQPTTPKFFLFLPSDIGQCESIDISWQSIAQDPVDILALIPGGQSFLIANITDGADSVDWTADVRQGTDIMFVAGDKDGLGSGGSSDMLEVSDSGDDGCINENSPSSTGEPAAGGVSSTQGSGGGGSGGGGGSAGSVGAPTGTGSGANGGTGASSTLAGGSGGTGTGVSSPSGTASGATGTNGGNNPSGTGAGGSNPTGGSGGNQPGSGSGSTNFPGSGGGTVTGPPDPDAQSEKRHSDLGLILGLVFGLLGAAAVLVGGLFYYRHRKRTAASAYHNLEPGVAGGGMRPRYPWVYALTRGAHIRGGAGSSVDTLPSMYQTEPFVLPPEHPVYQNYPDEPTRPGMVARASSSRSVSHLLGDTPYSGDSFGAALVGVHGAPTAPPSTYTRPSSSLIERKSSTGPHGRPPSRSASGRALSRRTPLPPPVSTETMPIRMSRDSEDFSPEPEEASPNPFNEPVVEIPPSYQSVRRASATRTSRQGSIDASIGGAVSGSITGGPQSPVTNENGGFAGGALAGQSGARLNRSNASRHSRRSTRSTVDHESAGGH